MTHGGQLVLHCYRLNSGRETRSQSDEFDDELIALMSPLLKSGVHRLLAPMDAYECRITVSGQALLATICCEQRPCLAAGVALDAASARTVWPEIEDLFRSLSAILPSAQAKSAKIRQPTKTPWCVDLIVQATEDECGWMEDFLRCLAWAWIIQGRSTVAMS